MEVVSMNVAVARRLFHMRRVALVRPAAGLRVLMLAVAIGLAGSAQAAWLDIDFTRISGNSAENVEGQLGLRVWEYTSANAAYSTSLTSNQVLITVTNTALIQSAVSEVFIDDGTIFAQSAVLNSLGGYTLFSGGSAKPDNLPGGENVAPVFEATSMFSADAQGNPSRGVDVSTDVLGLIYDLLPGLEYADTVAAVDTGELRFGFHVRSIGVGGDSDSFVNSEAVVPVPEPASLVVLGLGGLALLRRRR